MLKSPFRWYVYMACIILLLVIFVPLEYGSFRFKPYAYYAAWFSLGIILIKYVREGKKTILIFYIAITCVMLLRSSICSTGIEIPLYTNKKKPSVHIFCRTFDCFLSAGPCEFYKTHYLIGKLRWTTKIPKFVADTSQWEDYKPDKYHPN
jgi:hypothetical protein